jgi:hypothetical protein
MLCAAWIAQRAADEQIDANILATRDEISEFVANPAESRLMQGFREALFGRDAARLLRGELVLRVVEGGQLQLVSP